MGREAPARRPQPESGEAVGGSSWRRWREWASSLEFALARRFGIATREERLFFLLIGVVGVVGGLLGMATEGLIQGVQALLWGSRGDLGVAVAPTVPPWVMIAAPTAGGALVALSIWLGRRPVGGEGMSMLIEAVALSGGKIASRPVLLDALASIATVGSGGSLGREGPMIRLGAMISSWLGLRLGLPPHRVKILVGCGAAAGLAATYNIPFGGALFAMEVILGNFALEIFGPIVASSVIATVIARSVVGNAPLYEAHGYTMTGGWELVPYAGLGVVGALTSLVFMLGVGAGRKVFKRLTFIPRPLQPLIGMPLLGVIGLYLSPLVLGRGYGTINLALTEKLHFSGRHAVPELTILLLLGLAAAKLLATALTTGSGGSGGMFTPSLCFGALVGSAYGYSAHWLWPHLVSEHYGAYAAVGMAAVMAGTSHAPISAILILFEFTQNYDLILPVMLAAIIASLLARRLRKYSIYTESLRGRGIELPWRMEEAVLAGLKAEDLARPDLDVLHPGDDYHKVVETFLSGRRQRLFVVGDDDRRLLGAISLHDIKHVLEHPEALTAVVAHDLMVPVGTVVSKDERLHRATQLFAQSDYERLPVVDDDGRLLGVLAKRDLMAVYAQEVLGRPSLLATFVSSRDSGSSRQYVELPPDFALRMVPVPEDLVGRTLAEARLPQTLGARVIEIKRHGRHGEEQVIPDADTVLESGDLLVLIGPTAHVEALSEGKVPVLDEAMAHRQI
ncbi:MAG TPA: chloride channel protein, partial [Thermoanaerobaculia bacterium]|nr:chloride channel protein [Thermoanaerobaculia bacterium]